MRNGKAKRLIALALSVLLAGQLVTGVVPATADGSGTPAPTASTGGGKQLDFAAPDNGRPNLYVDFLGDNATYRADRGTSLDYGSLVVPGAYDQSAVTNPGTPLESDPTQTDTGNTWVGYRTAPPNYTTGKETIFWVGVGVDRTEVLKLLEAQAEGDPTGLFSLEVGFYYNKRYIEPYTNGDYAATLTKANLQGNVNYPDNTQWSGEDYVIRHAETDLDVQTEMITQEEIKEPSIADIVNNSDSSRPDDALTDNWRMTYVSLEMKPEALAKARRLAGKYDGEYFETDERGDPAPKAGDAPAAAGGTKGPEYLLLIPFVYKRHDPFEDLCLRLARNATHFSIGAGQRGTDPYAAWERVTTRNPGRDIKLLTRFTGDLNIFTGDKAVEIDKAAHLIVRNGGGTQNKVKMTVDGDPAVYPVWASKTGDAITGLQGGVGLKVNTTVSSNYKVTVTVHKGPEDGPILSHTVVTDQEEYTFVMPGGDDDVTVVVEFNYENADQFRVYLTEIQKQQSAQAAADYVKAQTDKDANYDPAADPNYDPNDAKADQRRANRAQVVTTLSTIATGDLPYDPHPTDLCGHPADLAGPAGFAAPEKEMTITVQTHADYVAEVRVYDYSLGASGEFVASGLSAVSGSGADISVTGGVATLPHGGQLKFTMVKSEVEVLVTYRPADAYKAYLEVWHTDPAEPSEMNTAQFAYLTYDEDNRASTAYSGQVYHEYKTHEDDSVTPPTTVVDKEDHRAVKDPGAVTGWVPKSAASLSGSLGGDAGAKGAAWTETANVNTGARAIMSLLYSASSAADLASHLTGQDLSTLQVASRTGMRKNLDGELYGDTELLGFANYLWELRTRILADTDPGGLKEQYLKEVQKTENNVTSTAYYYFDLTTAQVQEYIRMCLAAEEIALSNEKAYEKSYRSYLEAKAVADSVPASTTHTAPIAPLEPTATSVTGGVRTYQGTDYQTKYLADYDKYMTAYTAYIKAIQTGGGGHNYGDVQPAEVACPDKLPDLVTAPLENPATAAVNVDDPNNWHAAPTAPKTNMVQVRAGRQVSIVLAADSAYEVDFVRFYEAGADGKTGNILATSVVTAAQSQDFQNIYTFRMPSQDCVVQVHYKLRGQCDLDWEITGAASKKENVTNIVAYTVSVPAALTPTREERTNKAEFDKGNTGNLDGTIQRVLQQSIVTVTAKTDDAYQVKVTAQNAGSGANITVSSRAAADPKDGTVYTFTIPNHATKVNLTVAYAPKSVPQNTAKITGTTYPGDPVNTDNVAIWEGGGTTRSNVTEGTRLKGVVTVAPGYYIYALSATGASGSYPFTYTGDGYNSGYGTGVSGTQVPVEIDVDMPAEDLEVVVVFRKGPPPTPPGERLTLTVLDNANTGETKADNWAKVTIDHQSGAADTVLGPNGLGATGNGVMTSFGYAEAGDAVTLDMSAAVVTGSDGKVDPDNSYYIASVTAGPRHLGVSLDWVSPTQVKFTMPAGSTGVTVEFRKGAAPTYFLQVYRTENGSRDLTELGNQVTTADSGTIRGFNSGNSFALRQTDTTANPPVAINPERVPEGSGTGAAVAGESVTLTFQAKAGWYVRSVELTAGNLSRILDYTVTGGTNDGTVESTFSTTFAMPPEDAQIVVRYQSGTRPTVPEYALSVVLYDPENTETPADDNRLQAVTAGAVPQDTGLVGKVHGRNAATVYPQAGDTATITYQLEPGYVLEYMIVNPGSLGLTPTWVSAGTKVIPGTASDPDKTVSVGEVTFTMPAANATVVARVKKGDLDSVPKYTANLILRAPDGEKLEDVGMGTFLSPTAGSLDDYPTKAIYSLLAQAGTPVDIGLYAADGYYIRAITIDPPAGAQASLSGSFGYQDGHFVMPAANVNVNVWFEKGWPDEVRYDLTLEVFDASYNAADAAHNFAAFRSVGGTDIPAGDYREVYGNQTHTLHPGAYDRDTVVVDIHKEEGFFVSRDTISVTDSGNNKLYWWFVPGGIAFVAPPRTTTVRVTFLKVDEDKGDVPVDHEATLHIRDGRTDIANLSTDAVPAPNNIVNTDDGTISGLHAGDTMTVRAFLENSTLRHVASVYAVNRTTGEQVLVPTNLVAGGTDSTVDPPSPVDQFAMPEGDVDVYVTFADGETPDPSGHVKPVNLIVSGETGAGSAVLVEREKTTNTTGDVNAPGAGSILAEAGKELLVTFAPATGYVIAALSVTNAAGQAVSYDWVSMLENDDTDPSTWYPNTQKQITLTVPPNGGTVHVRYEKAEDAPTYTAQVVVNDEQYTSAETPPIPSRNDAGFPDTIQVEDPNNPGTQITQNILAKLKTAHAGDWIDLDVTVHEGYKIAYIKVLPQDYGVAPTLTLTPMDSQSTGFYMPAGNVTVYVKFVTDGLTRYTATLVSQGDGADDPENLASITSGFTGTKGPIQPNDPAVSVRAAAGREWVTVDYGWNHALYHIASITVKDLTGRDVPFTQVDPYQITLPMVAKDIVITVTYAEGPDPVGYPVVLHVIDKDQDTDKPILLTDRDGKQWNYARLVYDPAAIYNDPVSGAAQDTGIISPNTPNVGDEGTKEIKVPAGKLVDLTAVSDYLDDNGKVFIESAYVLYEAGGQMIKCNLTPDDKEDPLDPARPGPGFSGEKAARFAVHPGRNDVYVTLSRKAPTTGKDEFSAVLMLKGPEEDTESRAGICVGTDYTAADRKDSVVTNGAHGYVTATKGETITVVVVPSQGYTIDYILITPLGETTGYTRTGNTITIPKMPARNIAITVYLKESNEKEYNLTLHFSQQGTTATDAGANRADLFWTPDGATAEERITGTLTTPEPSMKVAENATVNLTTTLDAPYTVLAAYALRGSVLVPLSQDLEGVVEGDSAGDNSKTDGAATFTMPAGDVDVYFVVTDHPPDKPDWHTAVLLVTDKNAQGENIGQNYAIMNGDAAGYTQPAETRTATTGTAASPAMGHEWFTVWAGETVSTTVGTPQTGYSFSRPATISHSQGGVSTALGSATGLIEQFTSPYIYDYTVGDYNSAVAVHFESADAIKNPLTVIAEDDDNPGNGTVTNTVLAAPADMTALNLRSTTSAGAYQVIPDVKDGTAVAITVTPETGYYAYATYTTANTAEPAVLPLTRRADGSYTGSFTMPSVAATITVHFYAGYTGTLTLVNRDAGVSSDQATQVQMSEDFRGGTVTASILATSSSLRALPRGTKLAANQWDLAATSRITAVLLTERGSTTFLSPAADHKAADMHGAEVDAYEHVLGRADAEITFIVDGKPPEGQDPVDFVAAVAVKDAPEGMTPTDLADVVSDSAGSTQGDIWTTSRKDGNVTVTVNVPEGYEADVTTDQGVELSGTTDTSVTLTAGDSQTVTFVMPGANVQVTVTYRRTRFDLRLEIEDNSGVTTTPGNTATVTPASVVAGNPAVLNADGQATVVEGGVNVDVAATLADDGATPDPVKTARLVGVFYKTDSGATTWLAGAQGTDYNGSFTMPADDVTVTVVFGPPLKPEQPGDPTPEENYYIATVSTKDTDGQPGNRVESIQNLTTDGLPDGSPNWTAGLQHDQIHVSFTTEPGWYAVVTAWPQSDPTQSLTVIQQGSEGACTADVKMPTPAGNLEILITYHPGEPPKTPEVEENASLRLVGHDAQKDNKGVLTADSGTLAAGTTPGIRLAGADGVTTTDLLDDANDTKSPVRKQDSVVYAGDRLLVSGDWGTGYRVVRVTVGELTDPTDPKSDVINEVDVPFNTYASNAAARLFVPGPGTVVTLYYVNVYTATLHIVEDTFDQKTEMTDDRTNTVTSTGTDPVKETGDQLLQMSGGETVQTTAVPDTPNKKRLVGVVYESDLTGAGATVRQKDGSGSFTDRYDFTMPKRDTDVYVVYEEEPKDPTRKSYIAKVALHPDSVGVGETYGTGANQVTNGVTIANTADPGAAHGRYWTAARADEGVTITVNLIPGYQALVVSAKMDDAGKLPAGVTAADDFHFYVTRTAFVISGKTTSFTMPAETDVTVTVLFIKGYDLTLEVTDASKLATADTPNVAHVDVKEDPVRTLEGVSKHADGSAVEYTPSPAIHKGVAAETDIATTLTLADTPADPSTIVTRVTRYTPFTGTTTVKTETAAAVPDYKMPAENTVEAVLFRDKNAADDLLAKVQVKGESDINGNAARPIVDWTDTTSPDGGVTPAANLTTRGTVWTTTMENHTIDVSVTVAKGYLARVRVLRDDSTVDAGGDPTPESAWVYLDYQDYAFQVDGADPTVVDDYEIRMGYIGGSGDPVTEAYISPVQHFTFTMPEDRNPAGTPGDADYDAGDTKTDVTVIVEFVYAGTIPAPYDPYHRATASGMPDADVAKLQEGFIYGENRQTCAVVEIPTLMQDNKLYHTDEYKENDASTAVTFHFYLYDAAGDVYTELELGSDIEVEPYDAASLLDPADPYNYEEGMYTGTEVLDATTGASVDFVGSRFVIRPGSGTRAARLRGMLDNDGSLYDGTADAGQPYEKTTKLYVAAVNAIGEQSAYTEVWLRPAYTLALRAISYGPSHPITGKLYRLKTGAEYDGGITADADVPADKLENYVAIPSYTDYVEPIPGDDKWQQVVRIRTSELLGGYLSDGASATYALTLEKTSNLTYTRVDLKLARDGSNPYYDAATRTFSIQDIVTLIAGDADGDGKTKWQDYDFIRQYVERAKPWTTVAADPGAGAGQADRDAWANSVLNPESVAYRCDLNSDGAITVADLDVLTTFANYNKTTRSYEWKEGGAWVLPHGMKAPDYTGGAVLLQVETPVNLAQWAGDFPMGYDPVLDARVTPEELLREEPETPPTDEQWRAEQTELPKGDEAQRPVGPEAPSEGGPGEWEQTAPPEDPALLPERREDPWDGETAETPKL